MPASRFQTRLLNTLIIAGTLALVLAPVIYDQFRIEMARWQLAAASNAAQAPAAEIEAYVEAATSWVPDIRDSRDYWLMRIKRALAQDASQIPELVQQARERDASHFTLGIWAADQLHEQSKFAVAVDVLEACLPPGVRQDPVFLNQLAYYRSLSATDLEQALEDINQALKAQPKNAAMRDTRAWVLFQMGRPDEALEDAEFAVASLGDEQAPDGWLNWLASKLEGKRIPMSADNVFTRREAGELLWGRGALYYHRARILEALGRTEEAERDFQWLRKRRLPTDDRIN